MAKNKNYDKLSDFDNVDNVIEIEDVNDDKGKWSRSYPKREKKSCSIKRGIVNNTRVKLMSILESWKVS